MTLLARGIIRVKETGLGLAGAQVQLVTSHGSREVVLCTSASRSDGCFELCAEGKAAEQASRSRASLDVRVVDASHREVSRRACCWRGSSIDWCCVEVPAIHCPPRGKSSGHSQGSAAGHGGQSADSGHSRESPSHDSGHSHDSAHPHRHAHDSDPKAHCRTIYLKIEQMQSYSPVAPDEADHMRYKVDCMRNEGHEDGTIPPNEVDLRRIDAVVYRRYLDAAYTIPDTTPIIAADINEPLWDRRIPGCVLYADPGERLFIHVYNADDRPHSFHVHGLVYGIDSDGSYPFGVHDATGHRSDAICPGESWCYIFDVTEDTIGAWPFHDHYMDLDAQASRGLFGAVIVRDPKAPVADYHVPLFLHRLEGATDVQRFRFGPLSPGSPPVSHTFAVEGTYDYYCEIHPAMTGVVRVIMGGPASASVTIIDSPSSFTPADVTIGPGGTVTWTNSGTQQHTVTDKGTAALASWCLNGRTFVGNTPTIVAESGRRIRWYVFDLDLSPTWHNFHLHGQRWQTGHERLDTRSIGPAESFVVDTIVPQAVLPPIEGCCDCHGELREEQEPAETYRQPTRRRPAMAMAHAGAMGMRGTMPVTAGGHAMGHAPVMVHDGDCLQIRGDFLVHCHVEMHMMMGMAGLVRAVQEIEATDELKACLGFDLPINDGSTCPPVDPLPCMVGGGPGTWEVLADLDIFVVHAAVLRTGKVLLWSGTAEAGYPTVSRVWDPVTDGRTSQSYAADLFCSGHAWLPDGRLLVAGGAPQGAMNQTHIFDPATETWTVMSNMQQARWYPTVTTLPDGRVLAASGTGASGVEIWDPGTSAWQLVAGAVRTFPELFPSLHLLPAGGLFYSRCGWNTPDMSHLESARLSLTGPYAGNWSDLGLMQFADREEGMAVLLVDDAESPPSAHLYVMGGGVNGGATERNPQSVEYIDLTDPATAAWSRVADMAFPRVNVTAVPLPDGQILVIGGQRNGKWAANPDPVLEAEIYNPATDTWTTQPPMTYPRQYHSIAVLLPDGRVLVAGGIDPTLGGTPARDQRHLEVFSPPYLSAGVRPAITTAPTTLTWGTSFTVQSPAAASVAAVVLMRPGSLTHHTDAGLRRINLGGLTKTGTSVTVQAPSSGTVAPPGPYILFLVNSAGVPSVGQFVTLG